MTARAAPAPTRWTAQWKELFEEVITTGLCTGCAGCVVTCPHDVIGYEHEEGKYIPFHLEDELGPANCIHGEKGCTTCTRACPRFRAWEPAADSTCSAGCASPTRWRASGASCCSPGRPITDQHERGQDGGFVSAMLIVADASTTTSRRRWCQASRTTTRGRPSRCSAHTADEVLATAGSRYTYCANPLALREAKAEGLTRLALVGMGCQTSSPPIDVGPQGGQGVQAVPVQHRPALLEDVRRRDLPASCSRPSTGCRSPRW